MVRLPWYMLLVGLPLWRCAWSVLWRQSYKIWMQWFFCLKLGLEKPTLEAPVQILQRETIRTRNLGMSCWEMRTGALPAGTVAAATSKKVFKVHRRQKARSSLLAWAFSASRVQTGTALPGRAGSYSPNCTLCSVALLSPWAQPRLPFWIGPILFPS